MKCVECTHLTFVSTPYHRDTHRENMEQIQSFAAMKIQRKTRLRAEIVCSNSYLIAKIKAVLSHSSGIRASCVACIVAFLCIQSKMSKNGTITQSLWRIYSFITFLLFDAFSKKFFLSSTKRISIGIRMWKKKTTRKVGWMNRTYWICSEIWTVDFIFTLLTYLNRLTLAKYLFRLDWMCQSHECYPNSSDLHMAYVQAI